MVIVFALVLKAIDGPLRVSLSHKQPGDIRVGTALNSHNLTRFRTKLVRDVSVLYGANKHEAILYIALFLATKARLEHLVVLNFHRIYRVLQLSRELCNS